MFENTHKTITMATLNRIAGIDEFKGRWESLGQLVPHRLEALQRIANMEASGAAARMTGVRCSDRQVGELLNGHGPRSQFTPEEQEFIKAFHLVIKLINDSYEQIPFIDSHVLQLHRLLTNNGKATKDHLPERLSRLIEQTNLFGRAGRVHPLLIVNDFSYGFWHLRPFAKGNNRLTWLLARLLLLRYGYGFLTYGAIERFLEKRLADYQKTLLLAKDGEIVNPDPAAWLDLFLDALADLRGNIIAKIEREKKLLKLAAPHLEIIRTVQENGQATIAQIMLATGANRNTLKVRLRKLVAEKYLVQRGRGKSTNYILPELHLS